MDILFCIGVGLISGFMAGLLGIGGGIVIVPALVYSLPGMGVTGPDITRIAVATSLAVIIPTAISSSMSHARKDAVNWQAMFRLAPGVVAGSLAGAAILSLIGADLAMAIFAVFALYAAWDMASLRARSAPLEHAKPLPSLASFTVKGGGIGLLSALVGVGGGILSVPVLAAYLPMRSAVGTGAALGLPLSIAAASGYVLMTPPAGCPACVGYIFPQVVIWAGIAAAFSAPLGASTAHAMPVLALRRVFAVLLVFVGGDQAYHLLLTSPLLSRLH